MIWSRRGAGESKVQLTGRLQRARRKAGVCWRDVELSWPNRVWREQEGKVQRTKEAEGKQVRQKLTRKSLVRMKREPDLMHQALIRLAQQLVSPPQGRPAGGGERLSISPTLDGLFLHPSVQSGDKEFHRLITHLVKNYFLSFESYSPAEQF